MRKIVLLLMCLVLAGCRSEYQKELNQWMEKNKKVKVLCTIGMITDLVEQIGGDRVDVLTLIRGELDPHSYQLVKGDDEKLGFAELIFYNGLTLEHGPSLQQYLAQSGNAVALGDLIQEENPKLILHYNGQTDPHIWMDISLWAKTVPYIAQALITYDPDHAEEFLTNAQKVQEEMLRAHVDVKRKMHEIPEENRYLVTSHDAFNYFARAYLAAEDEDERDEWQKRFAAPEGLSPESQLSTTDIQLIIDHLGKYDIRILFPESNVSQDSIRKIIDAGEEHGMELTIASPFLYGDAMGAPGSSGDTYLKMVQHNARLIAKHLADHHASLVNNGRQ